MDFWTYLFLLSAFSSTPSKSREQRIYDRKIKRAKAYSCRRISQLSLVEQAEFDLPPYLEFLSEKFGIHEGTAEMVAQETGFYAHKGGLICQQTAQLYQKDPRIDLDQTYQDQIIKEYHLSSFTLSQILHTCWDLWSSISRLSLDRIIWTGQEDSFSRKIQPCKEFVDTAVREGTLYPLMNWCGLTEKTGSIQRAMEKFQTPLGPIFPVFLQELAQRNMGFAEGTTFPL